MASSLVSAAEVSMPTTPVCTAMPSMTSSPVPTTEVSMFKHESVYDRCAYAPQRIFEYRKMKVDTRNWRQRPHNISIHNKEEPHTH